MPNQRKDGAKQVTFFDWNHNVTKLRKIADREGLTLSELLRNMTKDITEKYGEKYKDYDENK